MSNRTPEEQAIIDHIGSALSGILDLGLDCNKAELAAAVHTLQQFVMMSVLKRVSPDEWNDWYQGDPRLELT